MSNRKKQAPQPQAPMPGVPAPFCDTYRYDIDHDMLILWGGMAGTWQAGMALPLHLAVDLHQKLGVSLAKALRPKPEEKDEPRG